MSSSSRKTIVQRRSSPESERRFRTKSGRRSSSNARRKPLHPQKPRQTPLSVGHRRRQHPARNYLPLLLRGGTNCTIGFVPSDSQDGLPLFTIACKKAARLSSFVENVVNSRKDEEEQEEEEEDDGDEEARTINIRTNLSTSELRVVKLCFEGADFLAPISKWDSSRLVSFLKRAPMLAMDELEIGILFALWKKVDEALSGPLSDYLRNARGRAKWTETYNRVRNAMFVNGCTPSPRTCVAFSYMSRKIKPKGLLLRHLKALCPPPLLLCWVQAGEADTKIVNVRPKTRAEHDNIRLLGVAVADDRDMPHFTTAHVTVKHNSDDLRRIQSRMKLKAVFGANSYVSYSYVSHNDNSNRYNLQVVHMGNDVAKLNIKNVDEMHTVYSSSGSAVALFYSRWLSPPSFDRELAVRFINTESGQTRWFQRGITPGTFFPNVNGAEFYHHLRTATGTAACVVALKSYMIVLPAVGVPVRVEMSPNYIVHAVAIHGQVVAAITKARGVVTINTFNATRGRHLMRIRLPDLDPTDVLHFTPDGTRLVGVNRVTDAIEVWSCKVDPTGRMSDMSTFDKVPTLVYSDDDVRLAYVTDSHVACYRKKPDDENDRYDIVVFRLDDRTHEVVKLRFTERPRMMAPQATDYYQSYGGRLLFDLDMPNIEDVELTEDEDEDEDD